MSVNKVILLGYVGADPEMHYPEVGSAIARFSLATSEQVGENKTEVTEWHKIVMYGENARFAERYIRKGTRLYVEGKLKYREYTDRMKINRKVAEITVNNFEILGRKPS